MSSCVLCASLKLNRPKIRFTTRAEAQSHTAQHFRQVNIIDEDSCVTLDQVLEKCFPNFVVASVVKIKKVHKDQGHLSLLRLCHTLFRGRISKMSPRVTCQKCGSEIVLYESSGSMSCNHAITHASIHLGIDLFECRKCECAFRSKSAVKHHLRTVHCLRALMEYYMDKSDDFIDEIGASIKECFDESSGPTSKKARMISLSSETHVRSNTKGSRLTVERQQFCYKRIRQLAGDDGKIQCGLCPMRINVRNGSRYDGRRTLEHALMHLKKPLYRCKICSRNVSSRGRVHKHLRTVHALTSTTTNYECLADEFHNQIMSMLQKCYASASE